MKKVDIIIPAYQSHATIDKTLASIACQIIKDFEINVSIVNDAGDGYIEQLIEWRKYFNIRQINRVTNGGGGLARQTGIDNTNGDYIVFIDSDDVFFSPLAISHLVKGIEGHDMCMGNFIEETDDGTYTRHDFNTTWFHGKIISRQAIERMNLRFNDTRINEDVGWNLVFRGLSDDVVYIDKDVYLWLNNENSTVRKNRMDSHFGSGWRGLIDNWMWAYHELKKRESDKAYELSLNILCNSYFRFVEAVRANRQEIESNRNKLHEMFEKIEGNQLKLDDVAHEFIRVQKSFELEVIPQITFAEYLKMLGYTG